VLFDGVCHCIYEERLADVYINYTELNTK